MSDLTPQKERELWIAFKEGDTQSLQWLYRSYYDRLYDYGFKFCRDQYLTEEAIQELFVKLLRNRQNLAVPDSVRGYLLHSYRMMMLDKMKAANRVSNHEELEALPFEIGFIDDRLGAKEAEGELYNKLQEALGQLTPRQREALFLRYAEEVPYEEIAASLEISQKAAYKLIGRAISALREAVGFGLAIGLFADIIRIFFRSLG